MIENQALINNEVKPRKVSLWTLSPDYKPEEILFREAQIKQIESIFISDANVRFKDYGEDSICLLLQGFSGSGKTTAIEHVLEKYEGEYLLATGSHNPTAFLLLKSLFDITASTLGNGISKAIEQLKEQRKVLVIDEINKLRNNEEIKLFFDMLNTIYREVKVSMILITNKKGFMDFIPKDGQLTFHPERLDFTLYDAAQLREILRKRINKIKDIYPEFDLGDEAAQEEKLAKVSKFVYNRFDGSVRSALVLLKKSILFNDFLRRILTKSF